MSDDRIDRSSSERVGTPRGNDGPSFAVIGFVIVAILAVIFFLQNGESTRVELWFFSWDTTIRWSLLVAIALGVLLDRLFGMVWRRRRRTR
jgi:uncharacterized integral membrane protein